MTPFCTSIAQRTASTTLRNSMMIAVAGAFDDAPVVGGDGRIDEVAAQASKTRKGSRSSSAPASRLYPTMSATNIAASFRVSLIAPLRRPAS